MAMEFSGEYRIPAAQLQVWSALNDAAVLQACIAGCTQLEKVSDTEFVATVAAKVGPVSATFRGNVILSDLNAPHGYTMTGQGRGGAAGFARMGAKVMLSEEAGLTVLTYTAQAEIGGKLASVGSRLVQIVAKKNADDFFAAFARRLGGTDSPQDAAPLVSGTAVSPKPAIAVRASGEMAARHSAFSALVPAWVVLFTGGLGFALGFCAAHWR